MDRPNDLASVATVELLGFVEVDWGFNQRDPARATISPFQRGLIGAQPLSEENYHVTNGEVGEWSSQGMAQLAELLSGVDADVSLFRLDPMEFGSGQSFGTCIVQHRDVRLSRTSCAKRPLHWAVSADPFLHVVRCYS